MRNFTVTELNDNIKTILDSKFKNKKIMVTGEISNLKKSGKHTFLTLKDNNASISVAFWRNMLKNQHGDNVEITGKIDYYTKNGNINLIGTNIRNIGVGRLHKQYEHIRDKYKERGYFDNKKPFPKNIKNIGLITSATGAAVKDFLYVLENNNFSGNVFIYDCIVQGDLCPSSVAAGIKFFDKFDNIDDLNNQIIDVKSDNSSIDSEDPFEIRNQNDNSPRNKKITKSNNIDVLVVTRGGGSFEDLIGFSHPEVIEAIYNSKIYTISAVGHEVDEMLSDYVANYRAPTPSIAGEVIANVNVNNMRKFADMEQRLHTTKHMLMQTLYKYKDTVVRLQNSIVDPVHVLRTKLDNIYAIAKKYINDNISHYHKHINNVIEILNINNHNYMLEQGFIVLTDEQGNIISNVREILNYKVKLIHSSGCYDVIINKIEKQ